MSSQIYLFCINPACGKRVLGKPHQYYYCSGFCETETLARIKRGPGTAQVMALLRATPAVSPAFIGGRPRSIATA
jgi:hypothetical protein